MGTKLFGARVTRREDAALVTGRGRYVGDIVLPGMLHAYFVRSDHAHAQIASIDTSEALSMPGVHAVLTADDLPQPMRSERIPMVLPVGGAKALRTQHALARGEVNYVGQTIAVVIADSHCASCCGNCCSVR